MMIVFMLFCYEFLLWKELSCLTIGSHLSLLYRYWWY